MKVLLIGGTRFIGPYVVKELVRSGNDVTVFHRGETSVTLGVDVRHVYGDRRRLADYVSELAGLRPDVVIDMHPLKEQDAVELMNTFRGLAGSVVTISSEDVYRAYGKLIRIESGEPDNSLLGEDSPLRQQLYPYRSQAKDEEDPLYSYDKIPIERAVMSDSGLPGTVLRLPVVYGPLDYHHRLFEYLKRMDDGRKWILLSEGKSRFQWTRGYVENVAQAIALASIDSRAAGRTYNIGEQEALTEAQWVRAIGTAAGWTGEVIETSEEKIPPHMKDPFDFRHHLAIDTARIRSELGYEEAVDRDIALRRTVEWERANPPTDVGQIRFDYAAEDEVISAIRAG